jgi:hypothetical protein
VLATEIVSKVIKTGTNSNCFQNYWGPELCPSPGIQNKRIYNISENGSVSDQFGPVIEVSSF